DFVEPFPDLQVGPVQVVRAGAGARWGRAQRAEYRDERQSGPHGHGTPPTKPMDNMRPARRRRKPARAATSPLRQKGIADPGTDRRLGRAAGRHDAASARSPLPSYSATAG